MEKHSYTILLAAAVLLGSCTQDIDLSEYRYDESKNKLTVNSIVCPDSTLAVVATRPYFFSDDHSERTFVPGLSMTCQVNDGAPITMQYDDQRHMYVANVKPQAGDKVSLSTTYNDKQITAEDVVPEPCPIESVTVSRRGPVQIYSSRDYVFTYKVTFKDAPGVDNYYFLQWDAVNRHRGLRMGERDFTKDIVFQTLANQVRQTLPGWTPYSPYGLPFSDKGIEGQEHTIVVEEIIQGDTGGNVELSRYSEMGRKFMLYAISKPYYNYLTSSLAVLMDDESWEGGLIDLGLANAEKIYTNINNGIGILGCYSASTMTIDPIKILGKITE